MREPAYWRSCDLSVVLGLFFSSWYFVFLLEECPVARYTLGITFHNLRRVEDVQTNFRRLARKSWAPDWVPTHSIGLSYAVALWKSFRGALELVMLTVFWLMIAGWGGCQKNINRLVSLVIDRWIGLSRRVFLSILAFIFGRKMAVCIIDSE